MNSQIQNLFTPETCHVASNLQFASFNATAQGICRLQIKKAMQEVDGYKKEHLKPIQQFLHKKLAALASGFHAQMLQELGELYYNAPILQFLKATEGLGHEGIKIDQINVQKKEEIALAKALNEQLQKEIDEIKAKNEQLEMQLNKMMQQQRLNTLALTQPKKVVCESLASIMRETGDAADPQRLFCILQKKNTLLQTQMARRQVENKRHAIKMFIQQSVEQIELASEITKQRQTLLKDLAFDSLKPTMRDEYIQSEVDCYQMQTNIREFEKRICKKESTGQYQWIDVDSVANRDNKAKRRKGAALPDLDVKNQIVDLFKTL